MNEQEFIVEVFRQIKAGVDRGNETLAQVGANAFYPEIVTINGKEHKWTEVVP
jgi:hypothetical protein